MTQGNPLREQPYLVARRVGGREVHTWTLRQGEAVAWEQIFRASGWSDGTPLEYAVVNAATGGGAAVKATHWTPLRARPRASMPPMQNNPSGKPPKYPWFVVNSLGRIVSGWEFKEDAKDDADSWAASGLKFRVLARRTVIAEGINPDTWASWEKDPSRDLALKYGLRNPAGACPTCGNAYNECECRKRNPELHPEMAFTADDVEGGQATIERLKRAGLVQAVHVTWKRGPVYTLTSKGEGVLESAYEERPDVDEVAWEALSRMHFAKHKNPGRRFEYVGIELDKRTHKPTERIVEFNLREGESHGETLANILNSETGKRIWIPTHDVVQALTSAGESVEWRVVSQAVFQQMIGKRVSNPAGLTAKGERMYEHIKAGYGRSPRAKEIAARTVYARAGEGAEGLVENPSRCMYCGEPLRGEDYCPKCRRATTKKVRDRDFMRRVKKARGMPRENPSVSFPTVAEVADVLKDLLKEVRKHQGLRGDGVEVRLQVTSKQWSVHHGDPGYDTDHHGWWGADFLAPDALPTDLKAMAKRMIEEAEEQFEQEID